MIVSFNKKLNIQIFHNQYAEMFKLQLLPAYNSRNRYILHKIIYFTKELQPKNTLHIFK